MHPFLPPNQNGGTASSPPRTKWWKIAGSTTALGAVAGAAHAETVQISLIGNQLSHELGNTLDLDLTGDGIDNLKSSLTTARTFGSFFAVYFGASTLNNSRLSAAAHVSTTSYTARVVGTTTTFQFDNSPLEVSALVPIQFTDARINTGAETNGLLEIRARNISATDHQISLLRLVFDDESTDEPTDAMVGGTKPEWVAPVVVPEFVDTAAIEKSKLQRNVKKLKRSLRKARRKGNRSATLRVKKKLKKLRAKLQAL